MEEFKLFLKEKFSSEQLLFDEPLKNHTSFKIGGNADVIVLPKNISQIKVTVDYCNKFNLNYYIIGNGTNLLVRDKGFRGVIIKILKNFNEVFLTEDIIVTAQAGATLNKISKFSLKNSLTGFEFASGIPGTIGGGVCMNAGAYGSELKNIVKSVTVLHNNEIIRLKNEECEFEYRNSKILKEKMLVLEVELQLKKGEQEEISKKIDELNLLRNSKQPVEYPSAGSVFKRPLNNFAGKLIMEAGFKGKCVGGACVSEKHCGFIINKNNATCADVLNLIEEIQSKVKTKFNVDLEKEVRVIGEE